MHAQVAIALSKPRILGFMALNILIVTISIWMFRTDSEAILRLRLGYGRFGPLLVHGSAVFLIALFGFFVARLFRMLFSPAPGLIVDPLGITDNSNIFSVGFISWSEIAGFAVQQGKRRRFIHVLVRDLPSYTASRGLIRRIWLMVIRSSFSPAPVLLSSALLQIDFDELYSLLERHLALHRGMAATSNIKVGDYCVVVGGAHAGKTGTVQDRSVSKTGYVTITIKQGNGDRVETLANNVVVRS